jgi:hypothetical protein
MVTVWVLIRRLNSSCSRSTALEVRAERHWLDGRRVKVNSRSPASAGGRKWRSAPKILVHVLDVVTRNATQPHEEGLTFKLT